jgi:acetyl/propionyl-CoA carboxylase alpha subunit
MSQAVLHLLCGEEGHQAVLRETKEGVEVHVDGERFLLQLEEVGPGRFVVRLGARVEELHCAREGDEVHLFWRGTVYRLRQQREGARVLQRPSSGGLEAPMPGKVIKLGAAPGQRVTKGQEILVIEAMKMENALRAPRDGIVKSVAVGIGDMVSPGVVLVELE